MKFSFKRGSGGFRRFLEVEGAHPEHRFVFLFHPLVFTCLGQTPGSMVMMASLNTVRVWVQITMRIGVPGCTTYFVGNPLQFHFFCMTKF